MKEFSTIISQTIPDDAHDWLLPTSLVAAGYGVSESSIRSQKSRHSDELLSGIHWIKVPVSNGLFKILWTRRGVIRLGLFIESTRGRMFRDYVETVVLSHWHNRNSDPVEVDEPINIVHSPRGKFVHSTPAPSTLRPLATPQTFNLKHYRSNENVVKAELVDDDQDWVEESDTTTSQQSKKRSNTGRIHQHIHQHTHQHSDRGFNDAVLGLVAVISFLALLVSWSVVVTRPVIIPVPQGREVTR